MLQYHDVKHTRLVGRNVDDIALEFGRKLEPPTGCNLYSAFFRFIH